MGDPMAELHALARKSPCPPCGAAPLQPCRNPDGSSMGLQVHVGRIPEA